MRPRLIRRGDQKFLVAEQMLSRTDEARLGLAVAGRAWAFDAPADGFKLGLEAYRIRLAHLFDPIMAVHTSNVQPLPHQITAVYEAMLPRQPLRYVLADDPGSPCRWATAARREYRPRRRAVAANAAGGR